MDLTSDVFHLQAYRIIAEFVMEAKKDGLDLSTLPPHLTIISHIFREGHKENLILSSIPIILQDINPKMWSSIAHSELSRHLENIGFIFWCLVADLDQSNVIFGLSYLKGNGFTGFISDVEFKNPPEVIKDPHQIMPYLHEDYESEFVVH